MMVFMTREELVAFGFLSLGENVKISRRVSIYGANQIVIGDNVRIDDFCILSAGEGGITIGSYIHLAAYSSLIGREHIEMMDFSGLSARVSVYSSSDDYSGRGMTNPTIPEAFTRINHAPVLIGRHAIVGAGSVLLPGTILEEGVAVGALSLVRGRCQEFSVYFGSPAKRISGRKRNILDLEKDFLASVAKGISP